MTTISFKIRFTSGETAEVKDIALDTTVGELKNILFERNIAGVEAEKQRLIFKGRILKDEQTLEDVGLQEGLTLHLVKSSGAKTATPTASPSAQASSPSTGARPGPTAVPGAAPQAQTNPFGMPPASGLYGAGGFDPFGGMGGGFPGMPPISPEIMQQMMNSPLMQRMLEDPELIRGMIRSNPMMQAMIEQNPQLEQVLSDPQMMRQAMQAAANPAIMQELLRSQDRALANIESLPGGHNALRRMFEQDIDPMVRAAEETSARLHEQQQQQQRSMAASSTNTSSTGGPAAAPMPNPWSSPQQSQQQTPSANPWASFGTGANPWAGMGSGAAANPFLSGAAGANPFAAMLQDPQYMQRLMDPSNVQAMIQLQQALDQLQRGGVLPEGSLPGLGVPPPLFGGAFNPTAGSAPGGSTTPAAPQEPPEVRFASQLSQLESMGFVDRQRNLNALIATNGNINAAVERLLQ